MCGNVGWHARSPCVHPVSITRFPLRRFSPGAGLLRNPLFIGSGVRFSRGWVRKDGNLPTETGCRVSSDALRGGNQVRVFRGRGNRRQHTRTWTASSVVVRLVQSPPWRTTLTHSSVRVVPSRTEDPLSPKTGSAWGQLRSGCAPLCSSTRTRFSIVSNAPLCSSMKPRHDAHWRTGGIIRTTMYDTA